MIAERPDFANRCAILRNRQFILLVLALSAAVAVQFLIAFAFRALPGSARANMQRKTGEPAPSWVLSSAAEKPKSPKSRLSWIFRVLANPNKAGQTGSNFIATPFMQ